MKMEQKYIAVDFHPKEVEAIIVEHWGRNPQFSDPDKLRTLTRVVNILQKLYFMEEIDKDNFTLVREAMCFFHHHDAVANLNRLLFGGDK
jgi:hypothetical protein